MTRLAIVGTGYVGLATGVCYAHPGHDVAGADTDAEKMGRLSRGEVPIVEHRLDELLAEGLQKGNLRFVVGHPGTQHVRHSLLRRPKVQITLRRQR